MNTKLLIVGLDVDDKAFHGYGICKETGECVEFSTRPNVSALNAKFLSLQKQGFQIQCCYESCHFGFSLARELGERGWKCEVIAPSSIPRRPGDQVKTDRIDARKLAEFYLNGQLTVVHVPDAEEEGLRDFIRSRGILVEQLTMIKNHIIGLCKKNGLHYREETRKKTANYFTHQHFEWLNQKLAERVDRPMFQSNLKSLLAHFRQIEANIAAYDEAIERASQEPKYRTRADALKCYRGFDILTAMTIVTELGDIRRFGHPKFLTSYVGLDLREYSSGGKERKFGVTRLGNRFIRTALVECSQVQMAAPAIGIKLKRRRQGIDPRYLSIADRCMNRVSKKAVRLLARGKHVNKIKVACVRETLGFIWESLQEAAKQESQLRGIEKGVA